VPRLARFIALHPDIDVRLNASSEPVDLINESVDIDIRYGARRLQPTGTMVLDFPLETIVPLC
jgi:LysR family glycine cleavage system transcriptional activator